LSLNVSLLLTLQERTPRLYDSCCQLRLFSACFFLSTYIVKRGYFLEQYRSETDPWNVQVTDFSTLVRVVRVMFIMPNSRGTMRSVSGCTLSMRAKSACAPTSLSAALASVCQSVGLGFVYHGARSGKPREKQVPCMLQLAVFSQKHSFAKFKIQI
jgi:hypothetical protein